MKSGAHNAFEGPIAAGTTTLARLRSAIRTGQPQRLSLLAIVVLAIVAATPKHPVTVVEGTNVNVTLSPDRKTIIMDLQEALWSLPIAGGAARRFTDPFLEPARPDWSPKGDLVAFQSFKGGTFHIWLMKPDGSGVRQLTDGHGDDRDPRFSPDGTKVAFSSDRAFKGNYDIWVADVATGKLTQWTSAAADEFEPAWLPDGSAIAYVSGTGANATSIQSSTGSGEAKTMAMARGGRAPDSPDCVARWAEGRLHRDRRGQGAADGFR